MINQYGCLLTSLLALLFHVQAVNAADLEGTSVQTGEFSSRATVLELLGESSAQGYESVVSIDNPIQWQVYVPESYDPQKPAGLLVYVSPTNSGQIPDDWKSLMEQHNLIWIAADQSGNKKAVLDRITFALLATVLIDRTYRIDEKRRYVSGFSGGGRVASMVVAEYPNLFKGAIYNCGVNFWSDNSAVPIDQLKQNRFVFITGAKDFNKTDTRRVYDQYEKAGVEQIKLMVIPFMGHRNPGSRDYGKAIAWLDGKTED